jgi:hypothetical protein
LDEFSFSEVKLASIMASASASFNLTSPNQIREKCVLAELKQWFNDECATIEDAILRQAVCHIAENLNAFVRFPIRPVLLWQGCDRIAPDGLRQKYHKYPPAIKEAAKDHQIPLDTRPNGPAITSFLFAGGQRPVRFGSMNAWSIHHLYSGKFPFIGKSSSLHSQKNRNHFTQSAGLIAAHPLADALSDEIPAFAWLLRAHSFQKFGYDPDGVFATDKVDEFGFEQGRVTEVFFKD